MYMYVVHVYTACTCTRMNTNECMYSTYTCTCI